MKKKATRKTMDSIGRGLSRRPAVSPRAKTERMLGRKLLRGDIPVVPPNLIRCPVPATHVKDYEEVCAKFARGEISEADVVAKVSASLKGLKPAPKPETPKPEEGHTDGT